MRRVVIESGAAIYSWQKKVGSMCTVLYAVRRSLDAVYCDGIENARVLDIYLIAECNLEVGMKAEIAGWFAISTLSMGLIFPTLCFAQDNSYSSTITTAPPPGFNTVPPGSPGTTNITTTTTATDNSGSWKQSAFDASHKAEVATKSVYDHAARDVKDISLEARITTVLHENKSTRGSDVHVTADNGIVTVKGHVPSEQNARGVQDIVASVYGVKAVDNELNYPRDRGAVTPSNVDSTAVAHPAYSDTAPAENAPAR
jgi:hypothetical protein